jgi:hypothetical protein
LLWNIAAAALMCDRSAIMKIAATNKQESVRKRIILGRMHAKIHVETILNMTE